MTSILVVDDHDMVRMGIVRMLNDVTGYEVVGEANSGEEGVRLVRQLEPDVVLMDVKMPGIGGLEATRKMLAGNPGVKIIAVTACDDSLYPERLIKAGAMGYVTKAGGFAEITAAINAAVRGRQYLSGTIAQQLALKSCKPGQDESPFERLSERELQTALLIVSGKRAQDIANLFSVSGKTVNTYRYRIFEKLEINSDVELALLAVKYNLLDPESVV